MTEGQTIKYTDKVKIKTAEFIEFESMDLVKILCLDTMRVKSIFINQIIS